MTGHLSSPPSGNIISAEDIRSAFQSHKAAPSWSLGAKVHRSNLKFCGKGTIHPPPSNSGKWRFSSWCPILNMKYSWWWLESWGVDPRYPPNEDLTKSHSAIWDRVLKVKKVGDWNLFEKSILQTDDHISKGKMFLTQYRLKRCQRIYTPEN